MILFLYFFHLSAQESLRNMDNRVRKKTELLKSFFFLDFIICKTDLSNINYHDYSHFSSIDFLQIQEIEIIRTIRYITLNKVFRLDNIFNCILIMYFKVFLFVLLYLFHQYLKQEYNLRHFQSSWMIIIRKHDKKNYIESKSYCSIVLFSIIDKTLKAIIVTRISWTIKKHYLLFRIHFRDRRDISNEYIFHVLFEKIYIIWETEKIASLFLLDISEAFDYIFHDQLFYNLQKREIEELINRWIKSFLNNCSIIISLSEYFTELKKMIINILQDSFIFFILYLFYNTDLLKMIVIISFILFINLFFFITVSIEISYIQRYINDIIILVVNNLIIENSHILEIWYNRTIRSWNLIHNSIFFEFKFQFLHFHNSRIKKAGKEESSIVLKSVQISSSLASISISTFIIKSTKKTKLLDIILEKQLQHKEYINYLEIKIIKKLNIMFCLSDLI